jgi:protein required for attachment to host cells
MDSTWIVSANAGRARIFAQSRGNDALEEINDMVNTTARERVNATETDEMGQRSAGKSRHGAGAPSQGNGYQQHQTPPQHQEELFARDVAHFLIQAHNEGRFRELCLVASPEFLGVLRKQVHGKLGDAIRLEINHDYTRASADELREHVQAKLRPH